MVGRGGWARYSVVSERITGLPFLQGQGKVRKELRREGEAASSQNVLLSTFNLRLCSVPHP